MTTKRERALYERALAWGFHPVKLASGGYELLRRNEQGSWEQRSTWPTLDAMEAAFDHDDAEAEAYLRGFSAQLERLARR